MYTPSTHTDIFSLYCSFHGSVGGDIRFARTFCAFAIADAMEREKNNNRKLFSYFSRKAAARQYTLIYLFLSLSPIFYLMRAFPQQLYLLKLFGCFLFGALFWFSIASWSLSHPSKNKLFLWANGEYVAVGAGPGVR